MFLPGVSRRMPKEEPVTILSVLPVDLDQIVAAVTNEREVLVAEPSKKGLAFGELVRRNRRRPFVDFRDDALELRRHPFPVCNRQADVGENARDIGSQCVAALRFDDRSTST
jgi:hypothetical protein